MPWVPGQSGNPEGRRTGQTAMLREMLDPHLPELFNRVLLMALAGDPTSVKLLVERVWPALKAQTAPVSLPDLSPDSPLVQQGQLVMRAIASGDVTPDVGGELMGCIATLAGLKAVDELEARIKALEGEGSGPFGDLA
jgi:hypothetical protein